MKPVENQLVLFERASKTPTMRGVAQIVRELGVDGLTEAERRADAARYQPVRVRAALNRAVGMPFPWTLNPYRGCTHACHYCFARRYHTQLEMDVDDEFASVILVKLNIADALRREVGRAAWAREQVAVGTATDPYQPIEGQYRLTRACLEVLAEARTPASVVTKGPMVMRDADVLLELGRRARCRVYMSVPTVDEDAWRALEPGTAPPLQRLRAVRTLVDAGVSAGVLMAPIVPGFSSSRSKVERTIKAIADHGARFVGCSVMHLQDGTREHFMRFLAQEFPSMHPRLDRLYASKYAPARYREEIHAMVRLLQRRHGLTTGEGDASASGGERPGSIPAADARTEQVAFRW